MALWGNNDNITHKAAGTVTLTYNTGAVVGSGTSFGVTGFAQEGDIIRFGYRGEDGVYFGDAVIKTITNATNLTIGSTAGLSGVAIAGTTFYISQLPKSTVLDHTYSNKHDTAASYQQFRVREALEDAAINTKDLGIDATDLGVNDAVENGGTDLIITGIGTAFRTVAANNAAGIGANTIFITGGAPSGIFANSGDTVLVTTGGSAANVAITAIGATSVSLASTISSAITAGTALKFTSNSNRMVSFASTILSAVSVGDRVIVKRLKGGYDRQVYGIDEALTIGGQESADVNKKYTAPGSGWVGVTTYIDCHGELRVKKEILVAMSGISTGNTPIYDKDPSVN